MKKDSGYYFSKAISYIFHPLLMPTFLLLFVFHAQTYINFIISPGSQRALCIVVFIVTFVFPVLSSGLLYFMGQLRGLEMQTSEERHIPFLMTALFYSLGYYLLTVKTELPQQLNLMLLGANISVVLVLLINLRWKVSAHAVGVGGLAGGLIGFSGQLQANMLDAITVSVIIAGLIGYARLRLNAHNQTQLYTGYAIGFLCEFLLFVFF